MTRFVGSRPAADERSNPGRLNADNRLPALAPASEAKRATGLFASLRDRDDPYDNGAQRERRRDTTDYYRLALLPALTGNPGDQD